MTCHNIHDLFNCSCDNIYQKVSK